MYIVMVPIDAEYGKYNHQSHGLGPCYVGTACTFKDGDEHALHQHSSATAPEPAPSSARYAKIADANRPYRRDYHASLVLRLSLTGRT